MNKIVYKFWLARDKLYSKGNKYLFIVLVDRLLNIVKRLKNLKKTSDLNYIYKNELDKILKDNFQTVL